jgi:flagellar hook-length control protein FliK
MMESLSPRDTASNNSFIQWQNNTTQSTNTTAPPPPTSFTPQAVPEQISFHLKKALADGVETLKISLKPASLGHVQVDMQVDHDGVLKAVISVEKPETLELLQRDARVLERALSDAGMKTDSNSLQFNLKQEQGFGQDFAERERTNSAPHTQAPLPDAPITDTDFIPTITHHYDGTLMRVDVMA